jgi:hypothetical protein|tara:strand:+ start:1191 stop:1646 length:456 start_codon:yes stop_codon:yes gene_type:complete
MSIIKPCRIKGVTMGKNLTQEKTSILKVIDFRVEINKKSFDLPLDVLTKQLSEKDYTLKKVKEIDGKYYAFCKISYALNDHIENLSSDEKTQKIEKSVIIEKQIDFRDGVQLILGIGKLTAKQKMVLVMRSQLEKSGKHTEEEINVMCNAV